MVFHYQDDNANSVYFTLYGPFDGYDDLADLIGECLDRYGIE